MLAAFNNNSVKSFRFFFVGCSLVHAKCVPSFMLHPAPWSGCLVNSSQTFHDECILSGVFIAINKASAPIGMQPNSSSSLTVQRAHEYACNLFLQHKLFVFFLINSELVYLPSIHSLFAREIFVKFKSLLPFRFAIKCNYRTFKLIKMLSRRSCNVNYVCSIPRSG